DRATPELLAGLRRDGAGTGPARLGDRDPLTGLAPAGGGGRLRERRATHPPPPAARRDRRDDGGEWDRLLDRAARRHRRADALGPALPCWRGGDRAGRRVLHQVWSPLRDPLTLPLLAAQRDHQHPRGDGPLPAPRVSCRQSRRCQRLGDGLPWSRLRLRRQLGHHRRHPRRSDSGAHARARGRHPAHPTHPRDPAPSRARGRRPHRRGVARRGGARRHPRAERAERTQSGPL
ncbi:MAG: hypothetical protein AVDCRST_MAG18-177, partial [uncultured Thermomicrobiales bacterium]